MKHRHFLGFLLSILFFYLFVLQLMAIWPFTIDDMYISLRYAAHWHHGDGLVWNIGEHPVEGYSNFLFVVVAALAIHCGINPIVMLKIMGIIGFFLASMGMYVLSRFWLTPIFSLIPVIWLLIYRDEILWVSSGLETTVFQALLIGSIVSLLRGLGFRFTPDKRDRFVLIYWILAGLGLGVLGLTRPEGAAVAAVLGLIALMNIKQANHANHEICYQYWFIGLGVFLVIYVPYFIWRWHYFGLLFPNPVYCKGMMDSYWWLLDKYFLKMAWPFLLIGVFSQWQTRDKRLLFLWIPSVVYLMLLIKSDPIAAFNQRLFLPALVLLFPLSVVGFRCLLGTIDTYLKPRDVGMVRVMTPEDGLWIVGVLAIWMALLFIPMSSLQQYALFTTSPQAGEQLRMRVIDWLKSRVQPSDQVVLADSGMIPFYVSARFEDSYCLNNQWMAKQPVNEMFTRYCQRVLVEKPSIIILTSLQEKAKRFYTPVDQCLKQKFKRQSDYQRRMVFQTGGNDSTYRYEIYSRRVFTGKIGNINDNTIKGAFIP